MELRGSAPKVEPVHGPGGIGARGRRTSTVLGPAQTMRKEDYEEAPHLFFQWSGGKREEHDTGSTKEQIRLDLVKQAMKIQFPDDQTRNHDDRTTMTTSWEALPMTMTTSCQGMKKNRRPQRRILTHWPRHKQQKPRLPWPQPIER